MVRGCLSGVSSGAFNWGDCRVVGVLPVAAAYARRWVADALRNENPAFRRISGFRNYAFRRKYGCEKSAFRR